MSEPKKPAARRAPGALRKAPGPKLPIPDMPVEVRRPEEPLVERLKREAKAGAPGWLVSVGVHVVLFAFLALIFITPLPKEVSLDVLLEWGLPNAGGGGGDGRPPGPEPEKTRKPITIASVENPPNQATVAVAPATTREPSSDTAGGGAGDGRGPGVKPAEVGGLLEGRRGDRRAPLLQEAGGGAATERAVALGLGWLQRQQQSGGNWRLHEGYPDPGFPSLRTDTGATALALLAFVGDGHTHQAGDHQAVVRKGLDWLLAVQKSNGDFHDHEELGRQTAFYAHSQATIAVCELFALTGDEGLREPAGRAVRFLIESQQPVDGGWKYQPQSERTVADLSVTGWALMALHTARAAGIDVPQEAFELSSRFLDSVSENGGALYRYEPAPDKPITAAMTAEGLLCRQFLGWPRDSRAMQEGVEYLLRPVHQPVWRDGRRNVYAWYYTGHVLHNLGGEDWADWYREAQEEIVTHQLTGGRQRGSWSPSDPPGADAEHSHLGGRLYVTALSLLILEMPYRHLPVYGE